jgi:hypothetical protein
MTHVYVILSHRVEPELLVFKNQAWLHEEQAEKVAQGLRDQLDCPATAIEVRRLACS